MTDAPQIRLEIKSNTLYLSGARELVASVARRLGFAEEACGQIALAVDEGLCNVIRHGYDLAQDRPIWISLWPVTADGAGPGRDHPVEALRIVIEDEARQVDPESIRSRSLDDVRPGGLGVHIIRAVMDDVVYEKRDGQGMRLIMTKRREPGSWPDGEAGEASASAGAAGNKEAPHA